MAAEVAIEVTLTETSTIQVVATANGKWNTNLWGSMIPYISPYPYGWIYGPTGPIGSISLGDPGEPGVGAVPVGSLTYVTTLPAGTYDIGVSVWQSLDGDNGLEVSVSTVVGSGTGANTIQAGT